MNYGSLGERWVRGVSWTWVNADYRGDLPDDFAVTVMDLDTRDRLHTKQGRSTARVVFGPGHDGDRGGRPAGDATGPEPRPRWTRTPGPGGASRTDQPAGSSGPLRRRDRDDRSDLENRLHHSEPEPVAPTGERRQPPGGALAVYLKRHHRLPWAARWSALFHPAGRYSPAAAEWTHLELARTIGVDVPEVVAAGEFIGPKAGLRSFLMIAELTGCEALNEALPGLAARLDPRGFAAFKRRLIGEMARITATLHTHGYFHKDLYLCHFFLEVAHLDRGGDPPRVVLIDLHRLGRHRAWPAWWRWKDLGQLLFSSYGVAGIEDRDRLRFWWSYRRHLRLGLPRWQAWVVRLRAARYQRHNRKAR